MVSKAMALKKPRDSVNVDLKLNLIQLLCLNTLSANHFSLKTKYCDNAE